MREDEGRYIREVIEDWTAKQRRLSAADCRSAVEAELAAFRRELERRNTAAKPARDIADKAADEMAAEVLARKAAAARQPDPGDRDYIHWIREREAEEWRRRAMGDGPYSATDPGLMPMPIVGPVERSAMEAKMTRGEFDAGLDPRDLAAAKALAAERLAETRFVDCRPRPWRWPEWASPVVGWLVTVGLAAAFTAWRADAPPWGACSFGAAMGFLGAVYGCLVDRAVREAAGDGGENAA